MHQQSANTKGKNASDIGLVIDAMDILHQGKFDGFVLVSSDSDFTRLASRIREEGLEVVGIGEAKTPESPPQGLQPLHPDREHRRRGRSPKAKLPPPGRTRRRKAEPAPTPSSAPRPRRSP
jgi:hypothetical protein